MFISDLLPEKRLSSASGVYHPWNMAKFTLSQNVRRKVVKQAYIIETSKKFIQIKKGDTKDPSHRLC